MNYNNSKERGPDASCRNRCRAAGFAPRCGRLQVHAVQSAEDYVQTETAVQRKVLMNAAAPDQGLRDQLTTLLDWVCGENLAPKHHQPQHNRLEQAMKDDNPQAHTEHQGQAMIPFVQNRPFQNRVSKRDKKYQKVTKSPIRPFHRLDILGFVVGFLSGPDTGHLAVKTGS